MSEGEATQAWVLDKTPPCYTPPLPLNRLETGSEKRQKRKKSKGDGPIVFI